MRLSSMRRYGIIGFFSLLLSSVSYADEVPVGQIIWAKGVVQAVQPQKAARPLKRRDYVFVHDVIVTNSEGSGEVAFTDNSVVTLRSDTEFRIDDYRYKPNEPAESKSIMSVIKGGFRTITGVIPKQNPDGYQINTPVATIGVRGTEFSVYIDPIQGLLVDLNAGSIAVRNQTGTLVMSPSTGVSYGVVNSVTSAPGVLKTRPAIFYGQPPTRPVAPAVIQSIPTTAVPVPGGAGSGGPTGPVKQTVSGFCVG